MPPKKLLLFFLLLQCYAVYSQKKQLPDSIRQLVLAARYHAGFVFAHNIYVQNTKGAHPNGFEFEYSHLRSDSATVTKFKCYPRSGFSFTYVDYHRDLLGKGYSLSYFLEPNYRLGNRLRMSLRASAGFSYLTNPFDSVKNPANQSYSGHINSFLQLDLGLAYPVSRHFAVYACGNFFHNSNGGFKQPNSGVNYINASIGLQYYTYSSYFPAYKKQSDTSWRHNGFQYDISLYYSPKGGYNADSTPHKKLLIGTEVQVIKQVSVLDAITASAEIYYDEALGSEKKTFIFDSSSNVLAGLLIGHQFLLNHFTFTQQLGFYIYKQTDLYDAVYRGRKLYHTTYQRWGLYYNIKKHWSVGINMLAHYQIADFIDGRVIYRIR
ncbi:MAG: acyloxyacyl hydrolase [Parafilimonas sp.]|nr:acyloxyacyl hydrolase [Parafilimonas sp.]